MAKETITTSGYSVDMEVLMQELGQFKPFHMKNYVLVALVTFAMSVYGINYVFLAGDVDYR